MILYEHVSYPLFLVGLAKFMGLITGNPSQIIPLVIGSMFPDFDHIINVLNKKGFHGNVWQHHKLAFHFPIFYLGGLILSLIFRISFLPWFFIGTLFHLFQDTFFCGEGIMWFFPLSRKMFNFFCEKTKGYHGWEWRKVYYKLKIFKFNRVFVPLMLIFQIILITETWFMFLCIFCLFLWAIKL